jgi:hypothetical protein
MQNTGNTLYTFDKSLDKLSQDKYMGVRKVGLSYLKIENATGHSYKEAELAGFRGFVARNEGDALTYVTFPEGGYKEIFWAEYALGFQYSKILLEDDMQGTIKKCAGRIGNAGGYTVEYLAADLINGAIGGSKTGIDGIVLCSASHPYIDYPGVQSNLGSAALSYTSLLAAIQHFKTLKDNRGIQMQILTPNLLIIPPALEWMAKELLLNKFKPKLELGTAGSGDAGNTNQVNLIGTEGNIEYVVNPYLTSSTAWFLMDTSQETVKWWWRRPYTFEQGYTDFDTDAMKMKASFRATADFFYWRGFYGSTP